MSEQANIDLVKQCYDAFKRGDIQFLLNACDDNVDWEIPQLEGAPFSGKRRGRAQVAEFFQLLAQYQEARDFRPLEFIAQGDRVVVQGHYEWAVKATGQDFGSDWCHIFTVRNGKIAAMREYMDTEAASKAYEHAGAAAGAAKTAQPGRPPVH